MLPVQDITYKMHLHPREFELRAENRVYLFGPFQFVRGSKPIEQAMWRRNKAKSLLKWFLLNPSRPFAADQLIELFWPDISPDDALRSLYVTVHYLRRLLEPDLVPHQKSTYLHRGNNNFYWLEVDENWWSDIYELEYLYTRAKQFEASDHLQQACFYYRKIVSYCSKGFLPEDQNDEAFASFRLQYESLYLQVLERLIRICLQQHEYDEVLEYSYIALLTERHSEPAIKAIINVYSQAPRATVETDQRLLYFKKFLHTELGVDTSDEWFRRIATFTL